MKSSRCCTVYLWVTLFILRSAVAQLPSETGNGLQATLDSLVKAQEIHRQIHLKLGSLSV